MSKVEVRSSTTHGNGVFATQNIKKGEFITQYPADVILRKVHGGYGVVSNPSKLALDNITSDELLLYLQALKYDLHIYGDPNRFTPEKCAHIINDAVKLDKIDRDPVDVGKELLNYILQSTRLNCVLKDVDGKCWAIASRDILVGEELFTTYQYAYWVPHSESEIIRCFNFYLDTLTPSKRATCIQLVVNFTSIVTSK